MRKRMEAEAPPAFVPAALVAAEPVADKDKKSRAKRRAPRRRVGSIQSRGVGDSAVQPNRGQASSHRWIGRNGGLERDAETTIRCASAFLYAKSVTVLDRHVARQSQPDG